jgi:hypothetical protein
MRSWQARADSNCRLRFRRSRPFPIGRRAWKTGGPTRTRTMISGLGNPCLLRLDDRPWWDVTESNCPLSGLKVRCRAISAYVPNWCRGGESNSTNLLCRRSAVPRRQPRHGAPGWNRTTADAVYKTAALPLRYWDELALGAGLEPAHFLVNSQAHCQFCYPRTTWWAITDSNCALSIKSRVLRRQSL